MRTCRAAADPAACACLSVSHRPGTVAPIAAPVPPPPGAFQKQLLSVKRREQELTTRVAALEAQLKQAQAGEAALQESLQDANERLQVVIALFGLDANERPQVGGMHVMMRRAELERGTPSSTCRSAGCMQCCVVQSSGRVECSCLSCALLE
jgi:hypothetical protein